MAISIKKYIQQIDALILDLENQAPKIMLSQAADAKALVEKRVTEKGTNANGNAFKAYSIYELPTFFFKGKGRRKSAEDALELKKYNKPNKVTGRTGISYMEWRKRNGLQVEHFDFSFTGRAWMNTDVVQTGSRGRHVYNATIGGRSQETKLKWQYNEKKRGPILEVSKGERVMLAQVFKKRVVNVVKKHLQ